MDDFVGKYVLCYGVLIWILKPGMISAVYWFELTCRICDGKAHYAKSPWKYKEVNETATGISLIDWEDKTLSNVLTEDTHLES